MNGMEQRGTPLGPGIGSGKPMSDAGGTEGVGRFGDLESQGVAQLVDWMHELDREVLEAVDRARPAVTAFLEVLEGRMRAGGRLFYIGAGTSGRLGVLDASECPPTFGVPAGRVVGLIAGGDGALRQAVEGAEDDEAGAWRDLAPHHPDPALDTLVGIAASGRTPYVLGGVRTARAAGLLTACVTCNAGSPLAAAVDHPIEAVTGPEFVTGSTRLKAGTATKLILNTLTTVTFIRLGHVRGTRMVDMQPSNAKLIERGVGMIQAFTGTDEATARKLLASAGSVRAACELWESGLA